MSTITWRAEKRKVKDLKHFEKNPRKITPAAMAKLKDRIQKRGFHDVVKVDTDNIVLSGNMRTEALLQLDIKEVNVLVPDRKLTAKEREAVVLESNRNDGEWDSNLLAEFDTEVLLDVGFDSVEVDAMNVTDDDEEDKFDVDKAVEAGLLPTPRATEAEGGVEKVTNGRVTRANGVRRGAKVKDVIGTQVGLKLQPAFALWMMGYDTKWLDLTEDEMPKSIRARKVGETQH